MNKKPVPLGETLRRLVGHANRTREARENLVKKEKARKQRERRSELHSKALDILSKQAILDLLKNFPILARTAAKEEKREIKISILDTPSQELYGFCLSIMEMAPVFEPVVEFCAQNKLTYQIHKAAKSDFYGTNARIFIFISWGTN